MKRFFTIVAVLLIAALAFVGCSKQETDSSVLTKLVFVNFGKLSILTHNSTSVSAEPFAAGIPVLLYKRNVGTQKESMSLEGKNRCKRGRSHVGKSAWQSKDVIRTEIK